MEGQWGDKEWSEETNQESAIITKCKREREPETLKEVHKDSE